MRAGGVDRLWWLIPVVWLLVSCSGTPGYVIKPERMARLLAELEVAESIVENEPAKFRGDSAKKVLLQSVYAHNGVTPEDVDTSMMWYGHHVDRYHEVLTRTVELLEEREKEAQAKNGMAGAGTQQRTVMADGDSIDVWPLERFWRITATSPTAIIRFNLPRDRNWEPGDGYELRVKAPDDARGRFILTLGADYQRPMRTYNIGRANGAGWHAVKLRLDSAMGATQVYGSLHYELLPGETVEIDSVQLVRTRWKRARARRPSGQTDISRR